MAKLGKFATPNLRQGAKGQRKQRNQIVKGQRKQRATKAYAYARTSTATNQDKAGLERQVEACRGAAGLNKDQIAMTVSEVISGGLPLAQRKTFMGLLTKPGVKKIFVESSRAVARDARVAEEVYQLSKKLGVQIIPADIPQLFAHVQNPALMRSNCKG